MNFLRGVKRGFVSNFVDSSVLEQPPYKTLGQGTDYEERFYPGGQWVFTTVKEKVDDDVYEENGTMSSFFRLKKYVDGENEDKAVIEMTFPVLVRVHYDIETGAVLKGEMGIFIHPSRQDNPPKPNTSAVYVVKMEPMRLYARIFSGYAGDMKYMTEKETLKSHLKRDELGAEIDWSVSYAAGYDAPTKMFNRRNEVWMRALNVDIAEDVVESKSDETDQPEAD